MREFRGRVAAITGAGSGIGRALANQLARAGAHLALSDIDDEGLAGTVAECEGFGVKITSQHLDVADRDAVYAWADRVVADHGKVNLIFNNAGVALGATVEAMSYEDFEWLMNINFWGVVYGTKAFLPHLKESGEGHVVNVSSVFGLISVPSQSAYNAAKFAVRGFTDTLRMELKIDGANVSVTTIHPGGIKTNIARNARMDASVSDVAGDPERAIRDFERAFITSPDKAARQILNAVRRDRRRALIGPDAKVIDFISRMPAALYQTVLTRGAVRHQAVVPSGAVRPVLTALRAEAVEQRADGEPPAPLHRLGRGPEPSRRLGEGHPLNQRDQHVRHIGLVAAQTARLNAAPHAADDQDPHRAGGAELLGAGREVGERTGEHDFGQLPVHPDEPAVRRGERPEVGQRIVRHRPLRPDRPAAGGSPRSRARVRRPTCHRRVRRGPAPRSPPARQGPGRETHHPLVGQQVHGGRQHAVPQLGGALLGARHSVCPARPPLTGAPLI